MELISKTIIISGIVQGVGYRYSANKTAKSMGIKGFVKNNSDGTVLIRAEATPLQMQKFMKWCYEGPIGARVNDVSVKSEEFEDFKNFNIKY